MQTCTESEVFRCPLRDILLYIESNLIALILRYKLIIILSSNPTIVSFISSQLQGSECLLVVCFDHQTRNCQDKVSLNSEWETKEMFLFKTPTASVLQQIVIILKIPQMVYIITENQANQILNQYVGSEIK